MSEAVGTTAILASGPPASETKLRNTVRRPSLSSAPPMAINPPAPVTGPGAAAASRTDVPLACGAAYGVSQLTP